MSRWASKRAGPWFSGHHTDMFRSNLVDRWLWWVYICLHHPNEKRNPKKKTQETTLGQSSSEHPMNGGSCIVAPNLCNMISSWKAAAAFPNKIDKNRDPSPCEELFHILWNKTQNAQHFGRFLHELAAFPWANKVDQWRCLGQVGLDRFASSGCGDNLRKMITIDRIHFNLDPDARRRGMFFLICEVGETVRVRLKMQVPSRKQTCDINIWNMAHFYRWFMMT